MILIFNIYKKLIFKNNIYIMKKYAEFINEEVGLRNLRKITKGFTSCEIYFHKDLDGVTSALAMKEFLKNYYNIETVDCHVIQYGGLEFAIKQTKKGNLPVLVDFAHSKPMFTIATDHHQEQVGGEATDSTYYKPSRSNVETISGEISYSDLFTAKDIELIQTVDSANFLAHDIKPEDLQRAIFKYEKADSADKNRFMMGFVVNRLLLAYKNKRITVKSLDGKTNHINRNILECLLLDSTTSLYSMFNNLRNYINNAKTTDKLGRLATQEEITNNLNDYIARMKNYSFIEDPDTGNVTEYDPTNWRHKKQATDGAKIGTGVHFDEKYKIISQYGGGSLFKPGSYDRYVPFKNYPDSEFFCVVWPMGLIQVSCNPFKDKRLEDINLGDVAKEVLAKHKPKLERYYISLESVKREFETSQDWKQMQKAEGSDYQGVGFKYSDLEAFYKDCVYEKPGDKVIKYDIDNEEMRDAMNTIYDDLSYDQKKLLNTKKVPVWELIVRNSGGHKSITNISGLNFLKYNKQLLKINYGVEKYVEVLKVLARELINNLKEKIDIANKGEEVTYDTGGVELLGQDTNESINYKLIDTKGQVKDVTKDAFLKAGLEKAMKPKEVKIDVANNTFIAKFENFKPKK
jgi:hypothetical protein